MNKKTIVLLFLIILVTYISFYPSLNNDFNYYDDNYYVLDNPLIKEVSIKNLIRIFNLSERKGAEANNISVAFVKGSYVPLTMLSFSFEYFFFGLIPRAYHATNLYFHILNTLLVFWLSFVLTKSAFSSFIISLLFGIHPLHVESVAWVSERKDVLYAFFFLLSIIVYLYFFKTQKRIYYIISILFFILSLLAKPMAASLPVVLILIDYLMSNKIMIKNKIPYFMLVIAALIIAKISAVVWSEFTSEGMEFNNIGIINEKLHYFYTFCYSILCYFKRMILPVQLSFIYLPSASYSGRILFFSSPCILLILFTILFFIARYSVKLMFGILFFLVTISPAMAGIAHFRGLGNDRYAYIPLFGFLFAIVTIFSGLSKMKKRDFIMKILYALVILIIILYSLLTYNRTLVWKNSISLWNDVVFNDPGNRLAHFHIGEFYSKLGNYNEALIEFNKAIEIDPYYEDGYLNRGLLLKKMEKLDDAIKDFKMLKEINPNNYEAYNQLGIIYERIASYYQAKEEYDRLLELPSDLLDKGVIHYNRGNVLMEMQDYKGAINDYSNTIKLKPDWVMAYVNRGNALRSIQEYERAIEDYSNAISKDNKIITAYINRGGTYFIKGDFKNAINDFTTALEADNNNYNARFNRAAAFIKIRKYYSAVEDLEYLKRIGYKIDDRLFQDIKSRCK